MNKFTAAYKNELVKLKQRKSIWILALLIIAALIFVCIMSFVGETVITALDNDPEEQLFWLEQNLNSVKIDIGDKTGADIKAYFDEKNIEKANEYLQLFVEEANLRESILLYETLARLDIKEDTDYRYELLNDACIDYGNIYIYRNVVEPYDLVEAYDYIYHYGSRMTEEYILECEARYDSYMKIINENDFEGYINIRKAEVNNDEKLDENTKKLQIENLQLRLDGKITGEYKSHVGIMQGLEELTKYKMSVETGIDYVTDPYDYYSHTEYLFEDDIEEYKQQIAIIEHKFESGYYNINEEADPDKVFDSLGFAESVISILMAVVTIFMITIASAMISSEMSNGSVKMLFVAPVKRWKLFAAKGAALMTLLGLWAVFTVILSILATGVCYGFASLLPYVYYVGGSAVSMPFVIYAVVYTLTALIPAIFYIALGLMFSAILKKTAGALGLTLGIYYVGSLAMLIASVFASNRWIKYVPIGSLNAIQSAILPNGFISSATESIAGIFGSTVNSVNIWFAIMYVLLWFGAIVLMGRDAFCRKDIK